MGLAHLLTCKSLPALQGVNLTQGQPMMAVYPGDGARYGKHMDATSSGSGDNGRVLTLLIYLNPFWKHGDGGCLRLFESLADEAGIADIEPLHGRLVGFFCRDQLPHEVLPALANRVAVTIWYYDGE